MEKINLQSLLKQMSIEEKVGQLVQLPTEFFKAGETTETTGPLEKLGLSKDYNVFNTGSALNVTNAKLIKEIQSNFLANSKHKIPLLFMADIIYGNKTVMPIPLAQSCSFDFEAIKDCASLIAAESYNDGYHVTFSPMLDIVRDPRWGRVMESFGEDVYVGKQFAKAMIQGFQGENSKLSSGHLAACLKHFACYGAPLAGRDYGAVDLSLQQFYEVHLPAYKAALDNGCKMVMTSFNTINGVPATGNKWLNRKVLRKELNFDGVLITDYAAIKELVVHGVVADEYEAAKLAMECGVDIDMKTAVFANNIEKLIANEDLNIDLLDEAVLRVLRLKEELGLFSNPYRGLEKPVSEQSVEDKKETVLNLARKTSVLLKNNGILPLDTKKKIALIGPHAELKGQFGMWAFLGERELSVDLKSALEKYFTADKLSYAEGSNILLDYSNLGFSTNAGDISKLFPVKNQEDLEKEALAVAQNSDIIVLAIGESMMESGEAASKTDLRLSQPQRNLIKKLAKLNKPMVALIYAGRPLLLSDIEEYFAAILYTWFPGTYGNIANAEILVGECNPSGKLSMTFPKNMGQIPIHYATYRSGRPIIADDVAYRFTSRYLDCSNAPLYPFGYGLNYSNFEITNIKSNKYEFTKDSLPIISATITNNSDIEGCEVVQLYIKDDVASISRPISELKATQRVQMAAWQSKTVEFKLEIEDLKFYNNELDYNSEPGTFTVSISNCSNDLENHVIIKLL